MAQRTQAIVPVVKKQPVPKPKPKAKPKPTVKVMRPVESAAVAYAQRQTFPSAVRKSRSREIVNSELITTVNGSTGFATTVYFVNPGIAATFPWLAQQANEWQQYRFRSLQFRYVTRTSTGLAGSVILSPDYNPSNLTPTTEAQATNTEDAVEDVIWKQIVCKMTPTSMHPNGPRKQIRTGSVSGDLNNYDVAKLSVCTTGEADTSAIGKLWVDYAVELSVPQNSPLSSTGPERTSVAGRATTQTFTTAVASPLQWDAFTFDPLVFGNAATGVFTPPQGTYRISGCISFNDTANETFTVSTSIQKNNANATPDAAAGFTIAGTASGCGGIVPLNAVLTFSGTDTMRVQCVLTGAAGTLTAVANESYLIITPA